MDVYKVVGKVFLIVTDDPDERIITVKSEPERARALQHSYRSIGAGRYLNKAHWMSVGAGRAVTVEFVEDCVTGSYDNLVVDTVPRRHRPRERNTSRHDSVRLQAEKLFGSLFLLAVGAGAWSLDAMLACRRTPTTGLSHSGAARS